MPPQQSSFIPKRNSGASKRQPRQNTFFVLGIISYACLIAAPTGSAAVYVYKLYTQKHFDAAVTTLDTEIKKFSEADMHTVIEYDQRLKTIKTILDSHISVNRALAVLEANTAQTVAFDSLTMERTGKEHLQIEADIVTDSFDAAMFQRKTYLGLDALASSSITDIAFTPSDEDGLGRKVNFKGDFIFDAEDITFVPDGQISSSTEVAEEQASTTATTTADSNETTI